MRKILACIILSGLSSCSFEPFEEKIYFNDHENFLLCTPVDIEFVKDSVEYISFQGRYTNYLTNMCKLETVDWDSQNYLKIIGLSFPDKYEIDRIELHYKHIRRINFAITQPPISIGMYLDHSINTREPIVEDSLEMILMNRHRGVTEVNTSYLKLEGGHVNEIKMTGTANKFIIHFEPGERQDLVPTFNFDELETDSCFVQPMNYSQGFIKNAKIMVNASTYLDIKVAQNMPSIWDCPDCKFTIYYKGNPTIVNRDSLDPRVIIVDNN